LSRGPTRATAAVVAVLVACCSAEAEPRADAAPPEPPAPPAIGELRIVAVRPHDPGAFTQGLVWHGGRLYESSGRYGRSELREVEPETGEVLRRVALPAQQFAEGLALVGDRFYQLTWLEGIVRLWRRADLAPAGELRFNGEGWGLAYDGERLYQSDGTSVLTLRSPSDFAVLGQLRVRRGEQPEHYLNELEWGDGALYANVWSSEEIVRIDPATGAVTAVFDASGLLEPEARSRVDVLNGIAWNPERRIFYLTGKLWPHLYEVELTVP
jgi:glutamine cyclotransferase